jgi:hypothetical protein
LSVLGISESTKLVYIGERPIHGRPIDASQIVIPISFTDLGKFACEGLDKYSAFLFLEDMYEPAAGIKRGRVFCSPTSDNTWNQSFLVKQHERPGAYPGSPYDGCFYHYQSYEMHHYIRDTNNNQAILGNGEFASFWKVVAAEQVFGGDVVVTLKSTRSNGVLPVLLPNAMSAEDYQRLSITLDEVQTANRKISPFHLVESCRNAASCAVGIYIDDRKLDLADAIKKVKGKSIVENTGLIMTRLHARAKTNAQAQHKTRDVTEEDAQTALHCLSLLLVELGLAKY